MQPSSYLQYIHSLPWIEASNAAVACLGAAAAAHAIFRSLDSSTSRAMRCGFVTLCVGLFGECLTILIPNSWQLGYDALMFGGSVALFVGSRRQGAPLPERVAGHVSIGITLYSWGVFFLTIQ